MTRAKLRMVQTTRRKRQSGPDAPTPLRRGVFFVSVHCPTESPNGVTEVARATPVT